jgi:hypothetical protein
MAQSEELVLNVKSDIGKVVTQTAKLEGAAKKGKKGFKTLGTAIKGVGAAMKAAGIGLIVGLLAKLMEVFSGNQKVLDAFDTGMTALNIAFNDLFDFLNNNIGAFVGFFKDIFENPQQALKDFGDMIKNNLIERFNSLLDTFGYVGSALSSLFKGKFKEAAGFAKMAGKEMVDVATGVDDSFDKTVETVTKAAGAIVDYSKKVITNAKAITEQNKAAEKAAVQFEKLNAQYLKDAEDQRQIRDDETKSFAKRIAANEELSRILKEQGEEQKKQIQIKVNAAQAQYDINDSDANFIALEQEKIALLQVEEAINGQMSEQLQNKNALEKELLESQRELRLEGMSGLERELQELKDAYELKKKMAEKDGSDTAKITAKYENQKKALVKANVEEQIDAYATLANALIGLAGESKELAIATAVIDTFVGANKAMGAAPPPLNFVMAAAVIAGGLANVRTIMQQDVPGGGGGGGGGGAGAASAPPAPQMMSGAFDISGGIEPEAAKAYVVTDEMTNSQNQLANIRRRATI